MPSYDPLDALKHRFLRQFDRRGIVDIALDSTVQDYRNALRDEATEWAGLSRQKVEDMLTADLLVYASSFQRLGESTAELIGVFRGQLMIVDGGVGPLSSQLGEGFFLAPSPEVPEMKCGFVAAAEAVTNRPYVALDQRGRLARELEACFTPLAPSPVHGRETYLANRFPLSGSTFVTDRPGGGVFGYIHWTCGSQTPNFSQA